MSTLKTDSTKSWCVDSTGASKQLTGYLAINDYDWTLIYHKDCGENYTSNPVGVDERIADGAKTVMEAVSYARHEQACNIASRIAQNIDW